MYVISYFSQMSRIVRPVVVPIVMMAALLTSSAIGLPLAAAAGSGSAAAGAPGATARPAQVPTGYLETPNGYFDPSCVYEVQSNQVLVPDGNSTAIVTISASQADKAGAALAGAGGSAVPDSAGSAVGVVDGISAQTIKGSPHAAACTHPQYDFAGRVVDASTQSPTLAGTSSADAPAAPDSTTPTFSGYVETASTTALGNMSYLHAEWNVPAKPSTKTPQTVYFFPGFENTSGSTIIMQPVLAWNQGGSGFSGWSEASWNCCSVGNTYHSSYAAVTGSTVSGDVSGNGCSTSSGVCSSWAITTYDYGSQRSVTFNTNAGGRKMNWVFGGALEAYSISSCNQWPGTSVKYRNFYLENVGNVRKYPSWSASGGASGLPSCGYGVTIGSDRSVTVKY